MQNKNVPKEENPSFVWSIRSCFFKPTTVVSRFPGIFPREKKEVSRSWSDNLCSLLHSIKIAPLKRLWMLAFTQDFI